MIKIITTKKWKELIAKLHEQSNELTEARGREIYLHRLLRANYNAYCGMLKEKDRKISELKSQILGSNKHKR